MKRASLRTPTKKCIGTEPEHHEQRIPHQSKSSCCNADLKLDLQIDCITHNQIALDQSEVERIKELPKEIGIMLITAGIVGLILPGPGTPALIAGGLALWPKAFGKLESWLERHHPAVHRESMKQVGRFLNDLETRYPYSDYAQGKQ